MKQFFIFLCIALFFLSCESENDATPVVISLKSGFISQTVESGKKVSYEFEAYSIKGDLNHLYITSFSAEEGEKTLIDSTIQNTQKINYSFIYQAPEFTEDSVSVTLKITVTDTKNNTQQFRCSVNVVKKLSLLPEMTGIVLYSGQSGRPDAFSMNNPSRVFLKALADSIDIDVFDYVDLLDKSGQLSREWRTNTNIRFAKVNSLNYSLATARSLENIYAAVNRQKYVNAIQANDVIVLGREDQVAGVLQVVYVADEEGTQNDHYLFNIKLISR